MTASETGSTDTPALDIEAIEARANAATDGPWRQEPNTAAGRVWVQFGRWNGDGDLEPLFAVRSKQSGKRAEFEQREADAEFITNARTDIPALIAEVRRLRDTPDNAGVTEAAVSAAANAIASHESRGSDWNDVVVAKVMLTAALPHLADTGEVERETLDLQMTASDGHACEPSGGFGRDSRDSRWRQASLASLARSQGFKIALDEAIAERDAALAEVERLRRDYEIKCEARDQSWRDMKAAQSERDAKAETLDTLTDRLREWCAEHDSELWRQGLLEHGAESLETHTLRGLLDAVDAEGQP